ncbi:MAG TPA: VOC family protein [Vicinamibacterales bacterium]|nr:VOC family protein [Vicinamibacterales bacterium]
MLDHLVYATPNLALTVADLEARLGVRAAPGGRHPGRGTRNALIALSEIAYLEIIGPDPGQTDCRSPRWFGIDALETPRVVAWAAKAADIEAVAARASAGGVALGPVGDGSRQREDGTWLRWRYTDPATVVGDGLVPFLIEWGASAHPAASAPRGVTLASFRADHVDPDRIRPMLAALDLSVMVERGPEPALIATLDTPRGRIELR